MPQDHFSKQHKLRLLTLVALGGVVGTIAAVVPIRGVQLVLVAVAVGLGLYGGLTVRRGGSQKTKTKQN